ncbi:MAG: M4 family metallopeptidase [Chloroflexi bacterium]|nr:M4 family metallopeptidase [Chloroflexota bacterium]
MSYRSVRHLAVSVLIWVLIVVALSATFAAPGNQVTPANIIQHRQTGAASWITFDPASPGILAQASVRDLSDQQRAAAWLEEFAPAFGVQASSLQPTGPVLTSTDAAQPIVTTRWQQTINGVPVYGATLVVNARQDGSLLSINGETSPALSIDTTPATSAADGASAALDYATVRSGELRETLVPLAPQLVVYDARIVTPQTRYAPRLAWLTEVVSTAGAPVRQIVLTDAATSEVLFTFNKIHAAPWIDPDAARAVPSTATLAPTIGPRVLGSPDLATYDGNNTTTLPGTFVCDESDDPCTVGGADTDADAAHEFAREVYELYEVKHGRDSLDGNGMQLISTVHHRTGYCNAFWNGTQMAYGDGCGTTIVLDDVVGHELTHGVTEFTSNLVYAYESGAINESFSDIWGELFDLGNGTAEDIPANRWIVGEELVAGGIRNMKNPPLKSDPDRTQSPIFYLEYFDVGGVHINSGIGNKTTYLMVDGDTFNSVTVTGIGIDKTLAVFYRAQTSFLTSGSMYVDLYNALVTGCSQLVGGAAGITAGDCAQVQNAAQATELDEPSLFLPVVAPVCDGGSVASDLFFEDFEVNPTSRWVETGHTTVWTIGSTDSPISGAQSLRGLDLGSTSDGRAEMNSSVLLPADAKLHFIHNYDFEIEGWDGGVVEYSTNGGASWSRLTNASLEAGEGYVDALETAGNGNTNVLAGQEAFGNSSFGVAAERYSLASLSGQSVRIRFRGTSDSSFGAPGWWVDDVRIYTCVAAPSNLIANPSFPRPSARPARSRAGTPRSSVQAIRSSATRPAKAPRACAHCASRAARPERQPQADHRPDTVRGDGRGHTQRLAARQQRIRRQGDGQAEVRRQQPGQAEPIGTGRDDGLHRVHRHRHDS